VYAAVLHEYNEAPRYEEVADPSPEAGQVVVEVGAAALHHLDLFKASGNFYLEQPLPSVVGTDGVGLAGGRRVYFDSITPHGSMAARSIAAEAEVFDVPDALDDPTAAAIANTGLAG
jgi:NADPH:quinone reductase-like Zn-dependent oxidoreductase